MPILTQSGPSNRKEFFFLETIFHGLRALAAFI